MRATPISQCETLEAAEKARKDERVFAMDEASFRAFYALTARPLWAYLARASGDPALAEDLLQETYYRFLRARPDPMSDAHRKNYLYRIATNLLTDHRRRRRGKEFAHLPLSPGADEAVDAAPEPRRDLGREHLDLESAFRQMKPHEREILWLAYAEGYKHGEIAEMTGMKAASLRPLLFRARKKLAEILRGGSKA
jgi:RNA polymerase sigma-70 factor, ECF subfamily